jgi:hypothetical protein
MHNVLHYIGCVKAVRNFRHYKISNGITHLLFYQYDMLLRFLEPDVTATKKYEASNNYAQILAEKIRYSGICCGFSDGCHSDYFQAC